MYVYLVRCKDLSLYCGYSVDVFKRFEEHKSGRGAKYTKAKGVKELCWYVKLDSKSEAMRLEYKIKKLSKNKKEDIIKGRYDVLKLLEK